MNIAIRHHHRLLSLERQPLRCQLDTHRFRVNAFQEASTERPVDLDRAPDRSGDDPFGFV
jgi:hypothetical protein